MIYSNRAHINVKNSHWLLTRCICTVLMLESHLIPSILVISSVIVSFTSTHFSFICRECSDYWRWWNQKIRSLVRFPRSLGFLAVRFPRIPAWSGQYIQARLCKWGVSAPSTHHHLTSPSRPSPQKNSAGWQFPDSCTRCPQYLCPPPHRSTPPPPLLSQSSLRVRHYSSHFMPKVLKWKRCLSPFFHFEPGRCFSSNCSGWFLLLV